MISLTTESALKWLGESNLRHTGTSIAAGGVNQGYNWQERSYPFVYTEITGYAVSIFTCAYRWTHEECYRSWAHEAAAFLLRNQEVGQGPNSGAIPHSLTLPDLLPIAHYYSFDLAICLQGLLDLHHCEPQPQLLQAAQGIGDWLLERMQRPDGSFLAYYDSAADEWHHPGTHFYTDYGCLHAKHAIGLLKLAVATGDDRYRAAAIRVCDWVLGLQNARGGFRANDTQSQIVSHAHCYATCGLLYAHYATGNDSYLQACRSSAEWLLNAQLADGSLAIEYDKPWWRMGRRVVEKVLPKRVTDATAQAARIWLLLYYLDNDHRYLHAAQRAGQHLQKMQCVNSADPNAVGGLFFWPGHPIMFAWATMFAAHALYALENYDRPEAYNHLITELF